MNMSQIDLVLSQLDVLVHFHQQSVTGLHGCACAPSAPGRMARLAGLHSFLTSGDIVQPPHVHCEASRMVMSPDMVVLSLHRWALDGHLGSADIVSGMIGRDLELSLASLLLARRVATTRARRLHEMSVMRSALRAIHAVPSMCGAREKRENAQL